MKQIQIKISPNGEIEAETLGIKGKKCLKYIAEVERLTNARVVDSDFTKEYLESENELEVSAGQEVEENGVNN